MIITFPTLEQALDATEYVMRRAPTGVQLRIGVTDTCLERRIICACSYAHECAPLDTLGETAATFFGGKPARMMRLDEYVRSFLLDIDTTAHIVNKCQFLGLCIQWME